MTVQPISVQDIVSLITAALAVIPSLIGIVIFTINLIKNRNWDVLKEMANTAMQRVEEYYREHPEMGSEQKLEMAIEIVSSMANVAGVIINEASLKKIIEYIVNTIALANKVAK